jgi:hypothetical protein
LVDVKGLDVPSRIEEKDANRYGARYAVPSLEEPKDFLIPRRHFVLHYLTELRCENLRVVEDIFIAGSEHLYAPPR